VVHHLLQVLSLRVVQRLKEVLGSISCIRFGLNLRTKL
jgi:hypothetical protein